MTRMAVLQAQGLGNLRQLPFKLTDWTPLAKNARVARKHNDIQNHYWVLIGTLIIISSASRNTFP